MNMYNITMLFVVLVMSTFPSILLAKESEDFDTPTVPDILYTPNPSEKIIKPKGINLHVVGGTAVSAATKFPWQASIYIPVSDKNGYICGGSLIHQQWILTAGHCVYNRTSFYVRLGSVNLWSGGTLLNSTVTFLHENYNPVTSNHDIALIKLPQSVTLSSTIKVIKILPQDRTCGINIRTFDVSGFGKTTNNGSASTFLSTTKVKEIRNLQCYDRTIGKYPIRSIVPTVICAVGALKVNQSTCSGDSGGPLVLPGTTPYLAGVASFVSSTGCDSGQPSGYTRTTPYLDWIKYTTGINTF